MFFDRIHNINEVLVRKEITEIPFFCDLGKCKGACCTLESDLGAPVNNEEIEKISELMPIIKEYIPQKKWEFIEKNGFYYEKDDELMLKSINRKDCVFVYFENDVAKCSIEKAYVDGKIHFKKPISCHLFPIRVSDFGGEVLRYEVFSECEPALEKGKEEGTTIAEFCKDSLKRAYGEKWFTQLMNTKRE